MEVRISDDVSCSLDDLRFLAMLIDTIPSGVYVILGGVARAIALLVFLRSLDGGGRRSLPLALG